MRPDRTERGWSSGSQPSTVPGPSDHDLAALDDLPAKGGTWDVFERRLRVTNLEKALFPGRDDEPPATKRELVRYSACIAPVGLPYVQGRALNMHR